VIRRSLLMTVIAALALTAGACTAPGPAPPPTPSAPGPWAATMLAQVNAQRGAVGMSPLGWCGSLTRAAQAHSDDQAAHNMMSHGGSDGSTFVDRATRAGYVGWTALAENVAYGYPSVDAVMAAWMGSSGHRANILNPAYTGFGAGLAYGTDGNPYWTQEFGRSGTC
jgi:uncharacterized protein YkwD